ncbi:MAG: hypothetical protein ACFE8B_00455 [Candidatus Hermodarchaeota archaeon]
MSEQIAILLYIKNMIADLIYLNGIIATELIKVTENTITTLDKSSCLVEHEQLNKRIIEIVKKYQKTSDDLAGLESHVLK